MLLSPFVNGTLYIQTVIGEPICEHRISSGWGLLIQSKSHRRDRTSKLDKLLEELDAELGGNATEFLTAIRVDKSRYARDQFRLIHSLLDQYGVEVVLQAIGFCQRSRLYSANTMRDYLEHQAAPSGGAQPVLPVPAIPVDDPRCHVTTQKRPLAAYAKAGGSGC